MATYYRTQAIFLKKQERGEADFLFTVFTKDFGKLEILGKAIRKIKSKLRAGAREFCLAEIEFIQGKTYKTLTDAILIGEFKNIKTDLEKLKIIYEISDVLDTLVRGEEKDEDIWSLLVETFDKLKIENLMLDGAKRQTPRRVAIENYKLKIIYFYFLYNLLSLLGYQPQLYNCPICEKKLEPEKLYWSSEEGGVLCQDCFEKITEKSEILEINTDIIKILRIFLKNDWQIMSKFKLSSSHLKQLKILSDDYLFHITGLS